MLEIVLPFLVFVAVTSGSYLALLRLCRPPIRDSGKPKSPADC
jgi:hypothetical protein